MPPYQDSLAAAQSNADVKLALGSPLEIGGFMGIPIDGSDPPDIQYNASGTTIIGNIPISGPNDTAMIYVEANSADTINWTYTVQEVHLNDGTVIDLLPANSGAIDLDISDIVEDSGRELIPDQE